MLRSRLTRFCPAYERTAGGRAEFRNHFRNANAHLTMTTRIAVTPIRPPTHPASTTNPKSPKTPQGVVLEGRFSASKSPTSNFSPALSQNVSKSRPSSHQKHSEPEFTLQSELKVQNLRRPEQGARSIWGDVSASDVRKLTENVHRTT